MRRLQRPQEPGAEVRRHFSCCTVRVYVMSWWSWRCCGAGSRQKLLPSLGTSRDRGSYVPDPRMCLRFAEK